jgi:hypothetical protein
MSLNASNLSVLAYANNFTLWHYTTADSVVTGTGYFNNASDMLRVNDLIIANYDTGGTPATKFYVVTANSGGVVAITVYA